jgi:restriction system protein
MGRRRQGILGDFVELATRLPWWAGLLGALITYLVLAQVASMHVEPARNLQAFTQSFLPLMFKTLAGIGQYVLPLPLVVGAVISAVSQFGNRRLFSRISDAPRSAIAGLSWQQFEVAVGEAFRSRGFSVEPRGGASADGGIDLVLTKGRERFLVQCKHWRANKVGVSVVRELYGAMAAEGAVGGFVVTSGRFTDEARRFAAGREIELLDGEKLARMFQPAPTPAPEPQASAQAAPGCPRCGASMMQRVAKRGSRAGERFWGCSRFPDCRGVRPV